MWDASEGRSIYPSEFEGGQDLTPVQDVGQKTGAGEYVVSRNLGGRRRCIGDLGRKVRKEGIGDIDITGFGVTEEFLGEMEDDPVFSLDAA